MRYLATALALSFALTGLSFAAVDAGVSAGINVSGDQNVNFSLFYEKLAPYGTWKEVNQYGWVWEPGAEVQTANWRPYMNDGHWVHTDYGWYWASDYKWGWAPFHYGRWTVVADKWVWVPGETWGPAWVTWREGDQYFGWAPLPPDVVYQPGVGLEFHGKHVEANFDFGLGANYFTFVPADRFLAENVATVAVPSAQVNGIFRETKVVNNSYAFNDNRIVDRGIDPQRVSRATKQQVRTINVTNSNTPVSGREALKGNTLSAFRPEVKKESEKSPRDFQQNEKTGASAKSKAERPLNTSVQNREEKANTPRSNAAQRRELNAQRNAAPVKQPEAAQPKKEELNKPATKPGEPGERRAEANPARELNRAENAPRRELNAEKPPQPAPASREQRDEGKSQSSTRLNAQKEEHPLNTSVEPRRSERAEPSNRAPAAAPRANEAARPSTQQLRSDERLESAPRAKAGSEELRERTDTSATKNDTEIKKSNPIR